jgi:galactose mutarotase-like enzyme
MSVDVAVEAGDLTRVVIGNDLIEIVVMPELGGKIWQITDKPSGVELLWHHPHLVPRRVAAPAAYDDVFFGGWDVLFPNDEPERLAGRQLPDHGEVWAQPWQWEVKGLDGDEAGVHLWVETAQYPCRLDTWLRLGAGDRRVRLHYRLANLSDEALPYLWKQHVAVALPPGSRVDVGAETMYVEDFGPTRAGATGVSYHWPMW